MDRRYELEILARSMAAMPPGQLALRREQAIDLLEELKALRGRRGHFGMRSGGLPTKAPGARDSRPPEACPGDVLTRPPPKAQPAPADKPRHLIVTASDDAGDGFAPVD